MEEKLSLLAQSALFSGINPTLLPALLAGLQPQEHSYAKGEVLLLAGYESSSLGIVLEGSIAAAKQTPEGAQLMIARMGAGGIFGDVLCGSRMRSPVTVTTLCPTRVLWLSAAHLLQGDSTLCGIHAHLLQNLIALIAEKYFALDRHLDLLMLKSLRAKVIFYLQHEAKPQADGTLLVPLTRAAFADYLGCERTALCRELSRMQADGVLRVHGKSFTLLKNQL